MYIPFTPRVPPDEPPSTVPPLCRRPTVLPPPTTDVFIHLNDSPPTTFPSYLPFTHPSTVLTPVPKYTPLTCTDVPHDSTDSPPVPHLFPYKTHIHLHMYISTQ